MKHLKTILVLTIVVVTSMMSVFFVEGITSPRVEARINEQINAALLEFFPEADAQPTYEVTSLFETNSLIRNVYKLQENGQDIGMFYRARFPGWIAPIEILIGIDVRTNEVVNVNVLDQGETPGIGEALLASPAFLAQFSRVQTLSLQEDGVDMPAGTSAPLTLGRFNRGVREILIYHAVNYLGEEAPVEETPEEIIIRLQNIWFEGDTFVDVEHQLDSIETLRRSSSGGYYFIVRFIGSGGETGEGITRFIVGFRDDVILGFEPLVVGDTPEYGGRYLFNRDTIAQFTDRQVEEFITTGLDAYTGATVTRSAFDQTMYQVLAYYQTQILGLEAASERAVDQEVSEVLSELFSELQFRNQSIKQGPIYGVYFGYDDNNSLVNVVYHIVHDNGGITSIWNNFLNHSIVEIDPQTNAIRQLVVFRNHSSYTTHYPDNDKGVELDGVDMSFLIGLSQPGRVSRDDFDVMSGASTEPGWDTMPALVNAIDAVLTYQQLHRLGGQ